MTADHLFPILESEVDSGMLVQVASRLAVGDIPEEVVDGIRLGRLTALAKPGWRCEGDRRRRHCSTFGGENHG